MGELVSSFDQVSLFLVILVPLLGGISLIFMSPNRPKDIWYFAIFVSGVSLALSVFIFARYDYSAGGVQLTRSFQWLEAPLNINLSLGIDGISAPLILLNGIVLFGGVLVSQTIHYRPLYTTGPGTSSCCCWFWGPVCTACSPCRTCSSCFSSTS